MNVLPVCMHVNHVLVWGQRRSSDPLGLELWLCATMWVLGFEPRSSIRAKNILRH